MEQNKEVRKFKLTYGALKNKNTMFILTILLSLFGWMSYQGMPRELFPEVVIPNIMVQTTYPGNSPVDIENLITRPIEKELKSLKGVKKLKSASYQDFSMIVVEFDTDVKVKQALQDVKDKVDRAKSELPDDLDIDPAVNDIDLADFPILTINLSGDYGKSELKKFAEDLKDELEALPEVSEADVRGIDEREIKINLDVPKMEANGITFFDIESSLNDENVTMGAGTIIVDGTRRSIRTDADYKNMHEIENTIIKNVNDKVIYLKDVAKVIDGYKEVTSISRLNNLPVVSLSVTKRSGENLLDAIDNIYKQIEANKDKGVLPSSVKVVVTGDMSKEIRGQINDLENSIILGMLLVIIVLYLFLGLRNALFAGFAIPMSMLISFIILSGIGYTINMMVLFSLVLALGMLVDNAIVVVENVYRLYQQGYSKMEATKRGVSEIAIPIIASTATTLAAFFPLVFWGGVMGEFMKYLPITLIIVLASSLFVALVLNPIFTSTFLKIDDINVRLNSKRVLKIAFIFILISIPFYFVNITFANILCVVGLIMIFNLFILRPVARWFQNKFLVWLEKVYQRTLRRALRRYNPIIYFVGMIVLMVFSMGFYFGSKPETVFMPEGQPKVVYVITELPVGTDITETEEISNKVENKVFELVKPYDYMIKSIGINVGSGKGGMFESSRSPNKSILTVTFKEFKYRRGQSTTEIMKNLTKSFKNFKGANIYVEKQNDGPPVGHPINLEISGDDFDVLLKTAERVKNTIDNEHIDGIEKLKLDLNASTPEMLIKIDREKVKRFGLSTKKVARTLRNALYGVKLKKFKDGEDEYDIFIRFDNKYRYNVSSLMNQKITYMHPSGRMTQIPISSVASYKYGNTYDKITRIKNTRVVTIYSNVVEGYNANSINAELKDLMSTYELPAGYKYKFTGEQEEQAETMAFLGTAMMIALSLIVLILVSQFNSAAKPFIIVVTVLFSTIGVFLGLGFFQMKFVVLMTGIGIISLAGIVVNNGIVLIDYITLLRNEKLAEKGLEKTDFLPIQDEIDCIILAGKTRLRPVLLTAVTTVLGLLPLALGMNFDFFKLFSEFNPHFMLGGDNTAFWGPMSWAVVFGLTFATFLTLVISPVMFLLSLRLNKAFRALMAKFKS